MLKKVEFEEPHLGKKNILEPPIFVTLSLF